MNAVKHGAAPHERTIDLAEIARVGRGERVAVQPIADGTAQLFEQTLALVQREAPELVARAAPRRPGARIGGEFIPENPHLRSIYLLAEAVGGYDTFNDLVNKDSPGNALARNYLEKAQLGPLADREVRALEDYQIRILDALRSATNYLREGAVRDLTREEMHELQEVILTASERSKELTRILGTHLLHRLELAVQRLHEVQEKTRSVEQTVDGIFLVDSEVMFIPTEELIRCVNDIFAGVGNPYLARNADGVMLLAARNLMIDVVSFFSYYGKNQIYNLFKRGGTTVSAQVIAQRIRFEVRKLFEACARDNRLVLTRIMKDAEREFELSVEAIQTEAEQAALEAVKRFIPEPEPEPPPPPRRSLLQRLLGLFR